MLIYWFFNTKFVMIQWSFDIRNSKSRREKAFILKYSYKQSFNIDVKCYQYSLHRGFPNHNKNIYKKSLNGSASILRMIFNRLQAVPKIYWRWEGIGRELGSRWYWFHVKTCIGVTTFCSRSFCKTSFSYRYKI